MRNELKMTCEFYGIDLKKIPYFTDDAGQEVKKPIDKGKLKLKDNSLKAKSFEPTARDQEFLGTL